MLSAEDARPVSPALLKVLNGAVDLHCHSGPSPFPRRFDHVEASYDGARIGMRAILVKSHHHNTVMDLLAMSDRLADAPTPVYGGIALNTEVGGVNPSAVAMACGWADDASGARPVSAGPHIDHHSHGGGFPSAADRPATRRRSRSSTRPATSPRTRPRSSTVVAETGVLLTGGHLDPESMKALFAAAESKGVRRLLVQPPRLHRRRRPRPTSRRCSATAPTSSTRSRCTTPR